MELEISLKHWWRKKIKERTLLSIKFCGMLLYRAGSEGLCWVLFRNPASCWTALALYYWSLIRGDTLLIMFSTKAHWGSWHVITSSEETSIPCLLGAEGAKENLGQAPWEYFIPEYRWDRKKHPNWLTSLCLELLVGSSGFPAVHLQRSYPISSLLQTFSAI